MTIDDWLVLGPAQRRCVLCREQAINAVILGCCASLHYDSCTNGGGRANILSFRAPTAAAKERNILFVRPIKHSQVRPTTTCTIRRFWRMSGGGFVQEGKNNDVDVFDTPISGAGVERDGRIKGKLAAISRRLAESGRRQDTYCANKEKRSCGSTAGDRDNGQRYNLDYTRKCQRASVGTARPPCNIVWTRTNI